MNPVSSYGKINYEVLGKVVDIDDPDEMRRIKVTIPELGMTEDQTTPWALPCLSHKSDWLPKKDDLVWIKFRGGNPAMPMYVGLAVTKDHVTDKFLDNYTAENRVDYDDNGNKRIWNKNGWQMICVSGDVIELYNDPDNSDNNYIKILDSFENEILLNKDGIKITDANDNSITKDSDGIKITDKNDNEIEMKQNEINITGTKVNILGATQPMILGQTFDDWLNQKLIIKFSTHTHNCPQSPSGTQETTPPLGDPLLAPQNYLSQTIKGE